jgi:hypothetical protein
MSGKAMTWANAHSQSKIGVADMLVNLNDGKCRNCGGQLEIVGADDISLEVECIECSEASRVETDAFGDGGIVYWPQAMVEFGEEL